MASKKHTNKLTKRIFEKVQKLSPDKPSNNQKEGVTVIEKKDKVYVYVNKRRKK